MLHLYLWKRKRLSEVLAFIGGANFPFDCGWLHSWWGLWWLMGGPSHQIVGSLGFENIRVWLQSKHKQRKLARKEYLKGGQILACYFLFYWATFSQFILIFVAYMQVDWVASTRTTQRQGKHNLPVLILSWSLWGRQGNNLEDVESLPTFESLIHSSGSRLHRLLWSKEQQSQEQLHILYLPWQPMSVWQSNIFINLWPL